MTLTIDNIFLNYVGSYARGWREKRQEPDKETKKDFKETFGKDCLSHEARRDGGKSKKQTNQQRLR